MKWRTKWLSFLKNTNKDIIMTEKDVEVFKNNRHCKFCENISESNTVRDHCHLTGKHKGPAHSKCYINVTQKQIEFIPLVFHNFSNFDSHLFF